MLLRPLLISLLAATPSVALADGGLACEVREFCIEGRCLPVASGEMEMFVMYDDHHATFDMPSATVGASRLIPRTGGLFNPLIFGYSTDEIQIELKAFDSLISPRRIQYTSLQPTVSSELVQINGPSEELGTS